mgnify:CR=1 FL=1
MILQLEIPQIAKQYAWLFLAQNNMGNRGHFDGDRNRQYTGLLGEICFKKLITGYWPTLKDTSTLEVCGWISKEDALAFGTEYPKGTIRSRRDGSTFELQAAVLEVEQRFLNPFRGHLAFNLESSQLSGPLFAPAQL